MRYSSASIYALSIFNALVTGASIPNGNTISAHDVLPQHDGLMSKRDSCRYLQTQPGSGCWQMAQDCGISQDQLSTFNPSLNCNAVTPGYFCCSSGGLPDFSPQPSADGTCAFIEYDPAVHGYCSDIAKANYLTVDELNDLNKVVWGWAGCNSLQKAQKICLSTGQPPMPAWSDTATCGPQVIGTQRPAVGTDIASLNPCSLNACCNIFGNCGLSTDFCTVMPADTGAPGTTKPGYFSCISNCGLEIINNSEAPDTFARITYFEAWNGNRPCLTMKADQIDTSIYTHVHFAFARILSDFSINVGSVQEQFDAFKSLRGIKKVVSFGGWAFSTEAPTYSIFGDGVSEANRLTFANNVANFVKTNNLDGVDFDWEYPSAPPGAGMPGGSVEQGKNYLEFLKIMRQLLPDKSLSFAAPASYWYLRGFPIKQMAETVDYIIYMTYDLHGQWDYGNKWAQGNGVDCPTGNCLRSHVNSTETHLTLAMITKAGVPAKKVMVGVSSYGRSFHMASAGCDGPDCLFTGSATESDAQKGFCTDTSGYIANAEIDLIIELGSGPNLFGTRLNKQWYEPSTDTDYIVYNDLEWVAFMSNATKARRISYYKSKNFGGTTEWAVDLSSFAPSISPPPPTTSPEPSPSPTNPDPPPPSESPTEKRPPRALKQKATPAQLKFQPALDFDTDGCFNVPAIDYYGNVALGLSNTGGLTNFCRDADDLQNNNVYVRSRCNNRWCVHLYAYYFEKDVAQPLIESEGGIFDGPGHRHDWEHIAVWTYDGAVRGTAASKHGGYAYKAHKDYLSDDTDHPKCVYHKDGGSTHAFRFGSAGDDKKIENPTGKWFYGALIDWNTGFPSSSVRDTLAKHDFNHATLAIKDEKTFVNNIQSSRPPGHEADAFQNGVDE